MTDQTYKTIEEALAATVWCEYYQCRILPIRCEARKIRSNERKWTEGDMAISYEVCEKCTQREKLNDTKI